MNWKNLTSVEGIEELEELSKTQPVVVFKHSTRCSISAASLNRLERKWDDTRASGLVLYFLDLIAYRDVSNAIAERYRVEHQSPQILMIKDGRCVYDNSHFGISFEELIDNIDPVSA